MNFPLDALVIFDSPLDILVIFALVLIVVLGVPGGIPTRAPCVP